MKHKLNLKDNGCLLLAPMIAAAVLLAVFILGGIYPFGKNTVAYYDMAQGIIPNFYHIWDALHEKDTALWFNWYSGLGVNDAANASLSVFWLVLLVIPRRLVGKAMGLYVILFFALSAFSTCLFLRTAEKVKPFWATVLSLCYAFCGFSVMYYTNAWQDTVFLFPLFMLSWLFLMKKGKILPYILMIMLNLLCGYYVFLLVILYIFFLSWAYIRLQVDRDLRHRRSFEIGIGTILGIGLSAGVLLPKLVQTLSSERFLEKADTSVFETYKQYISTLKCPYPEKPGMLFVTMLALAITVIGMANNRKTSAQKKENAFFAVSIMLMVMLVVCEGSSILMNFGKYMRFPLRTGYILSFALICSAGFYSNRLDFRKVIKKGNISAKTILPNLLVLLVTAGAFAAVYALLKQYSDKQLVLCMLLLPALFVFYFIVISNRKKIDYRTAFSGVLAEILLLSLFFIPHWETQYNTKEQNPAYIQTAQSLSKKLKLGNSKTQRVKTIGTTLNCNYGTVIGRATISDWTHLIPSDARNGLIRLGYSSEYTRIHDSGGTAFTDALLGVTNVLSVKKESKALYTGITKKGGYNYYECKYTLPYGILVPKDILETDTENRDWKALNNELYACLSGDSGKLIEDAGLKLVKAEKNTEYYTFTARKNTTAYFKLKGAKEVRVFINGKALAMPSIDREKNKNYPGRFNRNLVNLGEFEDGEQVEIKLVFKAGKFEDKKDFEYIEHSNDFENQKFSAEVGLLNLDKLEAVCNKYQNQNNTINVNNYTLTADADAADSNSVLLLPLQYNSCWSAKVNQKSAEVKSVLGVLTAVEMQSGENDVSMTFEASGLRQGILISAASLILLIAVLLLRRKNRTAPPVLCRVVDTAYGVAFYVGLALIYVIPFAYLLWSLLKNLFS